MKKLFKFLIFCFITYYATSSLPVLASSNSHIITDMLNRKITLNKDINSVVDLWHANNQVVLMLDGIDSLKGTTNVIHSNLWVNKIFPEIKKVPVVTDGSNIQLEEILKINPDVILTSNKNFVKQLEPFGLNVVFVSFRNMDDLKRTVLVTGESLGEKAKLKAEEYIKDFEKNEQYIKRKLNGTKTDLKILSIGSESDLFLIDGGKSITGEWMRIAGASNAFPDLDNKRTVSIEEIVKANPDIIIIGNRNAKLGIDRIKKDPIWKDINAVKNNQLYANPIGIFPWDRYSGEEALQILWVAQKINPELFSDLNMLSEIQNFYKKYYGYNLSKEDAIKLLNGEDPSN